MSQRTKIISGYSFTIVLALLVGLWAIANLYRLVQVNDALIEKNSDLMAVEQMIGALEQQDVILHNWVADGRMDAEIEADFRANEVQFLQGLSRAQHKASQTGSEVMLLDIENAYLDFVDKTTQLRYADQQSKEAIALYRSLVHPAYQQVLEASIALRTLYQGAIQDAFIRSQARARFMLWISIVFWLGAALVGLLFGLTMHFYQKRNVERVVVEKQRSEAIIRSISDGIVLVDASSHILTLNPEAAEIFDTTPETAQGEHLLAVVQNETIFDHVKQAIAEDSALTLPDEEATLSILRHGETYYYRHFVNPVRTADKKTLGVVLMLQDVTHLKELDQLKSELVMTVSHELRTPLTGIGMSIDLLQEDLAASLSPRQLELFQVAHDDVERLKALVNDLLDLTKLEAGQIDLAFEAVDVALLVERAMMPFTVQAAEQGVELINQTFDCSAVVWTDANKITWLMTNLIANALRYTDAGGHITISATTRDRWAFLSVADDGAGIPKSYQSQIFDKFVQVKGVRAAGGTGLGLAISKEIVKAHGGVIWVDSTPGQGSTFTFTLPLAQNQTSSTEATHYDRS